MFCEFKINPYICRWLNPKVGRLSRLSVVCASAGITQLRRIVENTLKGWSIKNIVNSVISILFTKKHAKQNTSVAQLVEQRSPKPQVGGSSPSGRANFYF